MFWLPKEEDYYFTTPHYGNQLYCATCRKHLEVSANYVCIFCMWFAIFSVLKVCMGYSLSPKTAEDFSCLIHGHYKMPALTKGRL
jgi:hypothetical protein